MTDEDADLVIDDPELRIGEVVRDGRGGQVTIAAAAALPPGLDALAARFPGMVEIPGVSARSFEFGVAGFARWRLYVDGVGQGEGARVPTAPIAPTFTLLDVPPDGRLQLRFWRS
jgi:hypothetical protein